MTRAQPEFDPPFWHLAEVGRRRSRLLRSRGRRTTAGGWVKDLARASGPTAAAASARRSSTTRTRTYREAGVRRVGLKVDSDNPTGAPRLYERLGLRHRPRLRDPYNAPVTRCGLRAFAHRNPDRR